MNYFDKPITELPDTLRVKPHWIGEPLPDGRIRERVFPTFAAPYIIDLPSKAALNRYRLANLEGFLGWIDHE